MRVVYCPNCIWYKYRNLLGEGEPWFKSGVNTIEPVHQCKNPDNPHFIDSGAVSLYNRFGDMVLEREVWKGTPGKWLDKRGKVHDPEGKVEKLHDQVDFTRELDFSIIFTEKLDAFKLRKSSLFVECEWFASKQYYQVPYEVYETDEQFVRASEEYCPECNIRLPLTGVCDCLPQKKAQ